MRFMATLAAISPEDLLAAKAFLSKRLLHRGAGILMSVPEREADSVRIERNVHAIGIGSS
jgi:hypothetical protein